MYKTVIKALFYVNNLCVIDFLLFLTRERGFTVDYCYYYYYIQ